MKIKKSVLSLIILCTFICLTIWLFAFYQASRKSFIIQDEVHPCGKVVSIGNNYFVSPDENPEGYSLSVTNTEIMTLEDYFESCNQDVDLIPTIYDNSELTPDYVYVVELTIQNIDNENGVIYLQHYSLFRSSLYLYIDYDLLSLYNPKLRDAGKVRLKRGTEKTLKLPFVPDGASLLRNRSKVNRMMKNQHFYLYVSEFPKRILLLT